MFDDQTSGLFLRQLGQRHHGLQQLAHIGDRQRGQNFEFHLLSQLRVPGIRIGPIVLGLSDEPGCQDGQCQVMFPGADFWA